jgi:hypothetical protein
MSSPTDRSYEPGDPSPYAPRWVRNVPPQRHAPVRNPLAPEAAAEGDEIYEASIAGDERDDGAIAGQEAPPLAAAAPVAHDDQFVIDDFRVPRSLDPGIVPDSWTARRARLRRYRVLGMLGRLALAGSAAAIVALLAIGKFSLPGSTGASERADNSPAFGTRFAAPAVKPQDPPIVAEGPSDPHQQLALADPSASVPVPPAAAVAVAPTASPSPASAPVAMPSPAPAATASPVPVAEPTSAAPAPELNPEELAALLKRGQQLAASGDIAAARLTLRAAAEARNAQAALALGATYDPGVLRSLGIFGVTPDAAMARSWYEKAKAYGSAEAMRRLELLARSQ